MTRILRLELTDKCNLKCEMCWSSNWKHSDMSFENLKRIIIDYKSHEGNGIVVLTSREPIMSKYFGQVLDLCTELELDVKILTNCTLINERICKKIIESNVSFIGISIHGNEELHDSITKVKGSFRKTLNGIEMLNQYKKTYGKNIDIRITTILRKELYENIDLIIKIASNLNTSLRIQHMMWYSKEEQENNIQSIQKRYGYNDKIITGFPNFANLDPQLALKIIYKAKSLSKKYNVDIQIYPELTCNRIKQHYTNNLIKKIEGYCDHPNESIRVRANGDVSFCQYIDKSIGNLCTNSLEEVIYKNNEYKMMCEEFYSGKLLPVCERCCHYINKKNHKKEKNYKI